MRKLPYARLLSKLLTPPKPSGRNRGKWFKLMFSPYYGRFDFVKSGEIKSEPVYIGVRHFHDDVRNYAAKFRRFACRLIRDLVRHIRAKGWKIITPTEAFSDPIAQYKGDLSFTKQGRVAALAHEAGIPPEKLRHPSESVDYLNKLFAQFKVTEE